MKKDLRSSQLRIARAKRNHNEGDEELVSALHDHAVLKVAVTFSEIRPWFDRLTFKERNRMVQMLFTDEERGRTDDAGM